MEFKTPAGYIRRGTDADLWLVDESTNDRWARDISFWFKHIHEIYVCVVNEKAVGFVVPIKDPDGYWRKGSVYFTPSVRNHNALKHYIGDFFKIKKPLNFGLDKD